MENFIAPYLESGEVLPIGQMQLEIHAMPSVGDYSKFSKFKAWWEKLEAAGLRPFWTEPNLVYVNIIRGTRPDLTEVRQTKATSSCAFFLYSPPLTLPLLSTRS